MVLNTQVLIELLEVFWINIVLSGDNALVIALACRSLPVRQRRIGIALGAMAAIGLRLLFTIIVVGLLGTPYLKIGGGLLLLLVAIKLLIDENGAVEDRIPAIEKLWLAIRTIAVADMVMSLDNVLAIAGVARDNVAILVIGLVLSIPLIVGGATLIMAALARLPILVWFGAGLLGWVAGDMISDDPAVLPYLAPDTVDLLQTTTAALCAVAVIVTGYAIRARRIRRRGQIENS